MALFSNAPMTEDMVRSDVGTRTKAQAMQDYSNRQLEIVKEAGGSFSDLPPDGNHEYYQISAKMRVLNEMEVDKDGKLVEKK